MTGIHLDVVGYWPCGAIHEAIHYSSIKSSGKCVAVSPNCGAQENETLMFEKFLN